MASRLKFVVENDSFLRLIQVVLDPSAPEERVQAFAHFCKHDTPDFSGWCNGIRARAQNIYPTEVRLVSNQAELLANTAGASVLVVEELVVGAKELAAAGNRSEEHTSELQSLRHLVCRLLLEKKN